MKCLLSALDIISTSLEVLIRSIIIEVTASIAMRLPRRGSITGALFLISLRGPDLIFISPEETWIFGRILLSIYNASVEVFMNKRLYSELFRNFLFSENLFINEYWVLGFDEFFEYFLGWVWLWMFYGDLMWIVRL